jgi:hypothetical protein
MSFITGSQVECLYSMPASGAATTAAAATIISGTTAANPPYQLPGGFFNPQTGTTPGKALYIKGGGWFSVGSTAVTTIFQLGLNTTAGTGTPAIVLGKTGTLTTLASQTNCEFHFEMWLTATVLGVGATAAGFNQIGTFEVGNANDAATATFGTTATTSTAQIYSYMLGTPQTAKTFNTLTAYYIEASNTWSVTTGAPTITLTNYYIFGIN